MTHNTNKIEPIESIKPSAILDKDGNIIESLDEESNRKTNRRNNTLKNKASRYIALLAVIVFICMVLSFLAFIIPLILVISCGALLFNKLKHITRKRR